METITIDLLIGINAPNNVAKDILIDHLTDYIYKYYRDNAAIQSVQVAKINGEQVDN